MPKNYAKSLLAKCETYPSIVEEIKGTLIMLFIKKDLSKYKFQTFIVQLIIPVRYTRRNPAVKQQTWCEIVLTFFFILCSLSGVRSFAFDMLSYI